MAKADIQLRGRSYSIACAPGQESRIEALSKQLDARVTQIAGAVGDIGDERLLLITALASMFGLTLFVRRTRMGRAMTAAADAVRGLAGMPFASAAQNFTLEIT